MSEQQTCSWLQIKWAAERAYSDLISIDVHIIVDTEVERRVHFRSLHNLLCDSVGEQIANV